MGRRDALMGWNNPAMHVEGARAPAQRPARGRRRAGVAAQARPPTEARPIERPAAVTPYAELHCHSHFSFLDGASSPAELVEEAVRLGLHALAITDHDGFYGAPMLAEAAAAYDLPTVFGAELSLGLTGPQNGVPDPEGSHLLVLARGRRGLPPARRGDDRRPPARRREGPPRLRPRRAGRAGARPLGGAHRLPQGRGPAGAGRRAARRAAAEALDRLTSLFGLEHVARRALARAPAPTPPTPRSPGWPPSTASTSSRPATSTTPPRSGTGSPRRWRPCAPGAASPSSTAGSTCRARPTCAAGRRRPPRCAAYPRTPCARSVTLADELAFDLRKASPALPKRQIPEGHTADSWLRVLAERGFAERYAGVPHERGGARAARARAAGHRREGLRRLLRHRPRHRRLRPRAAASCARAAARPPARRSATPSASPRSTRSSTSCRSSGSSPRTATRSPTSTSTSTPTGARRSSSGSTTPTVAATPPRSPTSSPTGRGWRCATPPRRSASPPASRTPGPSRSTAGSPWSPATRATPTRTTCPPRWSRWPRS